MGLSSIEPLIDGLPLGRERNEKDNTFRNLYDFNVPVHLFNAIGAITLARIFGLGMDNYNLSSWRGVAYLLLFVCG